MCRINIITAILLSFIITLQAWPIDKETAKQVAVNFYLTREAGKNLDHPTAALIHNETASMYNDQQGLTLITLYYIYNINNEGFVIVSGDDAVLPVIGYSTTGIFPQGNLPAHITKWFDQYRQEIRYVMENKIQATEDIKQNWHALTTGGNIGNENKTAGVSPLLKTKWNQSPYYNDLCPGKSVTGCVATAMAQVMKYWNHPKQGTGYHSYTENDYGTVSANFGTTTYNWSSMPNEVNAANNAVATLMFHCGVSVDMNYSPQVSGAWVIEDSPTPQANSEYALKKYFNYSPNLKGVKRKNYTAANWINLMKGELNAGRPILHAGFKPGGGHAFVCDGYDDNNYFHFNWGWGGFYDGYFLNHMLNPGGEIGYNDDQEIITGIQPVSVTQPANIVLYSAITVNPNPIQYGQGFTVNADITNLGSTTFYGDITAALFDKSGNFIDYIKTFTESNGLKPNYHYTNGLDFTTTSIAATPGDYNIGIYVKPENEWIFVGHGNYTNYIPVAIVATNNIELYEEIMYTPDPLVEDQFATFSLDVANFGPVTYTGSFSLDIHEVGGAWIKTIKEYTGMSLCPNCHYTNGLLFSTSNLNLEAGPYLIVAWEKAEGGDWEIIGSTYYTNPIEVTVFAPQLAPDAYENNNTQTNAYSLPLVFTGNIASVSTTGSSIHNETDLDFYKIVLPSGYNYTLNPRVFDIFNSVNGQNYTNDVVFYHNATGMWSEAIDDVLSSKINMQGNTVLYLQVSPWWQGQTGTYLLQAEITRTPATSVENTAAGSDIKISPNPTTGLISVTSNTLTIRGISIYDEACKLMIKQGKSEESDLTLLPAGVYFIAIETDKGAVTKKITKITR